MLRSDSFGMVLKFSIGSKISVRHGFNGTTMYYGMSREDTMGGMITVGSDR